VAGKQGGKSKRPQNEREKNARLASRRSAAAKHVANFKAQEKRHQENLEHPGDPLAWALACVERARRRAILAAAWAASPWRPGDATNREKSVREYILAHPQPDEASPA
jgi:hypothetical protein